VTYLVDANVLSETTKPRPDDAVVGWLRNHEGELSINPVILGEIESGVLLLVPGRRREQLLQWFNAVVKALPAIPIDANTAHAWARLLVEMQRKGRAMPIKDSLIAATAIQHGMTVATRNTSDYGHCGVRVVDPFAT